MTSSGPHLGPRARWVVVTILAILAIVLTIHAWRVVLASFDGRSQPWRTFVVANDDADTAAIERLTDGVRDLVVVEADAGRVWTLRNAPRERQCWLTLVEPESGHASVFALQGDGDEVCGIVGMTTFPEGRIALVEQQRREGRARYLAHLLPAGEGTLRSVNVPFPVRQDEEQWSWDEPELIGTATLSDMAGLVFRQTGSPVGGPGSHTHLVFVGLHLDGTTSVLAETTLTPMQVLGHTGLHTMVCARHLRGQGWSGLVREWTEPGSVDARYYWLSLTAAEKGVRETTAAELSAQPDEPLYLQLADRAPFGVLPPTARTSWRLEPDGNVRRQETLSRVIYLENGTFTSPSVSVAESDAEIAIGATQFTIERTKDMDELRYTARTARSVRSRIIESGFLNELPVVLMDRSHTRYVVVAKDRYILLDENLEGTDAPSLLDAVSQLSTLGFLVLVAALFGSPLLVLTAAAAAAWRSRRGPAHRLWIWQSYVAVGCVVYLASSVVWLPRITDLLP